MARSRKIKLRFPVKGLDRRLSFERQPPYSSPDLSNVRVSEVYDERERGGSRPGTGKAILTQLGSGNTVNLLASVTSADSSGFRQFVENFNITQLSGNGWAAVSSYSSNLPGIYESGSAIVDDVEKAGAIRDALDPALDNTQAYTVEVDLATYEGQYGGKYYLWACANDSSPDPYDEGLVAELIMDDETDAYEGTLYHYKSGSLDASYAFSSGGGSGNATAGKFWFLINGSSVKVYWNSTQLTSQTLTLTSPTTHRRVGFALECTVEGGACLVSSFKAQYYTDDTLNETQRTIRVAASNGTLYKETTEGTMEAVSSNLDLNSSLRIRTAEYQNKLYIADRGDVRADGTDGVISGSTLDAASVADWSAINLDTYNYAVVITNGTGAVTDGTYYIDSIAAGELTLTAAPGDGSCSFHIERAPKIYDPTADTLTLWQASSGNGQVPTGCDNIDRYRGRIVMAKNDENLWYVSRQFDPLDWNYGADSTDYGRAVAGSAAEAGEVGQNIKAIMPYNDDYMLFGCESSIWILRGDPATPSATLGPVSRAVGCVGGDAWCTTDRGEIVFLADSGLYALAAGGDGFPAQISVRLPRELKGLNSDLYQVSLAYDRRDQGVHIFVYQSGVTQGHWWVDWKRDGAYGIFPVSLPDAQTPFCTLQTSNVIQDSTHVMMGCEDGYLRFFSDFFNTDDGTEIESYVDIGPFALGDGASREGRIQSMQATLGYTSGSVDWSVRVDRSAEAAFLSETFDSGTWDNTEGVQLTDRLKLRGMACIIRLDNSGLTPWSMEHISAILEKLAEQRLIT